MATTTVIPSDASTLGTEALEVEITTLAAHLNAGTFRFLALIADFDTRQGWGGWGIRSCAHWLNWKCGLGLNAAREQLRVAHALSDLPHVSDAMRQGQLSYTKVRAITRVATPDNEQCLLAIARNGTASHVETVVRHYRRTKRIEELARDTARHQARSLRYFWDHDGCLVIEARLPPEQGALVVQALRAADEALRPHPVSTQSDAGLGCNAEVETADAATRQDDCGATVATLPSIRSESDSLHGLDPEEQEARERLEVAMEQQPQPDAGPGKDLATEKASAPPRAIQTSCNAEPGAAPAAQSVSAVTRQLPLGWAQRQADAFSLMAETMLAQGPVALKPGDRHLVHVRIDLEALCHDEGIGRSAIEDGPTVPPETVRRLCCDGGLVTWLHDGEGNTLDVGRKTRVVPSSLRRLVERRDGGCRFPGCEQRRFVDAHHIHHWVDGGRTDADNLTLLCRHHHRLLHEGGYSISGNARGIRFIDPEGRLIERAPGLPVLHKGHGLVEQHVLDGLTVGPRTATPGWGGERADYTWMLTVLDQHDQRAARIHD